MSRVPLVESAAQALCVVLGAAVPTIVELLRGLPSEQTERLLQLLTGSAALTAGVAMVVCWSIVGFAFFGWFGVALLDLGVLGLCNNGLAAFNGGAMLGPVEGSVTVLIVAWLLWRASRTEEVDSTLSPVRLFCGTALSGLCVLVGLFALSGSTVVRAVQGTQGRFALDAAGGAVLAGLGAALLVAARRRPAVVPWAGWPVLLFGAGHVLAAALSGVAPRWGVAAAMIELFGLSLGLIAAVRELRAILTLQDRHSLRLRLDVRQLRGEMEAERGELQERLHDLRNAVSSMRSADSVLRRYEGRLDETTRVALSDAFSAELARLQNLIEPSRVMRPRDVLLHEVFEPVVSAERSHGCDITVDVGAISAVADPDALAQVLQNLLVNARRYASGSPVQVTAVSRSGRVEVFVSDNGPGVPEQERLRIFGRGERGAAGAGKPGSGLGLFVAARLLAEMGGSIHLDPSERGACFLLELPASSVESAEPGATRLSRRPAR